MPDYLTHLPPGYLFVAATLLPLASFLLIFLASGLWCIARRYREAGPGWEAIFQATGGDRAGKLPAYLATAAIGLAFVCSLYGGILHTLAQSRIHHKIEEIEKEIAQLNGEKSIAQGRAAQMVPDPGVLRMVFPAAFEVQRSVGALFEAQTHAKEELKEFAETAWETELQRDWKGTLFELVRIRPANLANPDRGTTLSIGYSIDSLAVVMFVMVTFIATLIHLFSIGYMSEEAAETVEDHQVHTEHGHLVRRGRFGRFFMYLSLFCFSMLNLVLADNLFQVFISWELVGICSYLLIGFYYERQSASDAANKAFITNRVGDAGFILGLLILFGYFGTFQFDEIFAQVRHPVQHDAHGHMGARAGQIVRADYDEGFSSSERRAVLRVTEKDKGGEYALLFPSKPEMDSSKPGHFDALATGDEIHPKVNRKATEYGSIPYWMLVAAGLGIFLGCVGKSAQFPLQVWLPDAMEGPTPVSALIHAATMVAAGVYLVGRTYPLFTVEVLLVIAYTGTITLFVAATIAVVMTDIKKVLAYSTVSQLGYMMLGLGVGGWAAGLFHLITHACFKALLFLGSGSVIYGCHHEQEMTRMGGLYPKMKITAITMLIGVLTIAGLPLLSGWYSKDAILAHAFGFVYVHRQHGLLFGLPLATAGITCFYMFRMWLLTFAGEPRDQHVYEHAHESPWLMTVPLIILAGLSVGAAWGWPLHDATQSHLEHHIHHSQPAAVVADFGHVKEEGESWPEIAAKPLHRSERYWMHDFHTQTGLLALGLVVLGITFAMLIYRYKVLDPAEAKEQFPGIYAFLVNKWYFDQIYSVLLVKPAMVVARAFRTFDLKVIDGVLHALARWTLGLSRISGLFDNGFIDYLVNLVGRTAYRMGTLTPGVQTGYLRSYVLFLVLAAIGLFAVLAYFGATAVAGG
jgi:NADH-quinone oxidoreductase subunit L